MEGTRGASRRTLSASALAALGVVALLSAGCGSSQASSTRTTTPTTGAGVKAPAIDELASAEHPAKSDFPGAAGRSLQQLAKLAGQSVQLGPATGTYTPGTRRFAFALTDSQNRFVYAPTAVYLATSPTAPAQGPFLAPADPVGVAAQYRSKQNAAPGGLQAIYGSEVPVPQAKVYDVLALSRTGSGIVGATNEIAVAKSSPIPGVGQRPPDIATETLPDVHGDVTLLTTRQPPEEMHSASFSQVLGKRPVALLISTPELCTSRVCGPVTDIIVSLQHDFPGIAFIHQEVYVNNNPTKGLRPQLHALHLETEPWLFVINRHGTITARLEGAFGVNEAREALQTALS